ncbi:Tc toxin subunit A [Pseudomonas fluorescens]|uniref:Tc toxin subunit A n=1 Tax=Pseudomonas fluorescens TaxID=294 RepID=UPI00125BD4AC|nr:Tc toxin subunit A [Pseudomonas fluorescens]VVN22969.1 hypothetical protein PS639_04388 [Pseudomonas fluorescens]
MAVETNSLMNALVPTGISPKKGQVDFERAMQEMGFTSVFDIIRLARPAFARQLAEHSDADAGLAYDNAMAYAALIARLYREYKTSSGTFQSLATRSGIRALVPGPTFPNLFKENWDEFCKVGAIAAVDSPVAYLSALRVFIQQLEDTSEDSNRILLDKRRPDLKALLITQESTFTPRPMLEIVNDVLGSNLRSYLNGIPADRRKPTTQVLAERRYPFELPYNFHHHQCQLGLSANKPRLGELNYRASRLLPIEQAASNRYGEVQNPVLQAQRLLSGLSPQQQALLIEPSLFSNFYLTRNDLTKGWKSAGTTYLNPHHALTTCWLLPLEQPDLGVVIPQANIPTTYPESKNVAPVTFRKLAQTETASIAFSSININETDSDQLINRWRNALSNLYVTNLQAEGELPEASEQGFTARFSLFTGAGPGTNDVHVKLAKQTFTLTLDEQYSLTDPEKAFFKQSYGLEISESSPLWHMVDLNDFMQRTGLHAEQVEMLLSRRTYSVRLSVHCPSLNRQHAGVTIPGITGKVVPFPHASHYGACYVNGTGTGSDLYDSQIAPTPESIVRDQFDNAMGLEQAGQGDAKYWYLTKTSLNRFDRLQRMIRLQRWTGIPFPKLDTLVICAIRAEGEGNLGMEFNDNTLRALGVYRYLNQRYGIDPQEFAALMHDLTPYASGKEVPLFDQVFNRVQLFDTPLILDQTPISLTATDPATQKTLLQLCAGLGLQPTEESLLLIARQTERHLTTLKRDLPTVSSIYRQARIAQLFGLSVADLLTLAGLLGGLAYKSSLASGHLNPPTQPAIPGDPGTPEVPHVPDILDVLMQLDWAVDWLKDSQQTVAQLQARLGPNVPLKAAANSEGSAWTRRFLRELEPPDWPELVADRDRLLEPDAGAITRSNHNALDEAIVQIDAKDNRQLFSRTLDGQLRAVDLRLGDTLERLPMAHGITYNAHGQVEKEVAGNGVVTFLEYNAEDGRLKRMLSRLAQNDPLQDLRYLYDPVGNVSSIEDAALPIRYFANQRIEPVSHYRYDTLYRLIEATGWEAGAVKHGPSSAVTADPAMPGHYRQTYRYDDGDNLLELTHVGPQNPSHRLVAAAHSNRCLPVRDGVEPDEEDFRNGFDANGNLLKLQPGQTLSWDVRNQLREVRPVERDSGLDDCERYFYGADGMRVRKVRSLQTNAQTLVIETRYLPGLEIRTHSGTGEHLHVIVIPTGRGSVRVLHWETTPPKDIANHQQRYSLTDHLGSSTLELDQDTNVITQERYYPFGGTAWSNGAAVQVSYKTVRYSGKEQDATGLYYYGFRYYVPWLGRWLNPDPAEDIDGVNRFRAMRNNLLRYRDLDGLVSTDDASETMAGSMHTNSVQPSISLPAAVGSSLLVPNVQKIGRNTVPVEQQNSTFEIENPLSGGRVNSVQERSSLNSKVKGISFEAQSNLLVMEKNRQFVGVMSVKSQRVDIAISSQLGVPGSDIERPMPRGVTYKVGPASPNFSFALEALHSVGKRADGSELDFTGHSMMVKMLSGEEKNYIGFSGVKRSDEVIRLKWTSRTLNPEHAAFISKYHLGNPGVEQRDYVLSKKYQDIVVKRFERSGYTVIKD